MGQSFPVVIDHQLEHLKLNDIVKTTIRGGDTSKDFNVKTAIKSEPGLSASTVNNLLLDDGDEEVNFTENFIFICSGGCVLISRKKFKNPHNNGPENLKKSRPKSS